MTTPTTEADRIVSRIKKLLASADTTRNSNLHEAEAAAALAQELITRYQVTAAQLAAYQPPDSPDRQIASIEYFARGDTNLQKWERALCNVICLTNQCRLLIYKGSTHLTIFGTKANLAIVIELFEELRSLIRTLSDSAYQREGYGQPTGWKTSFCLGATSAIYQRMKAASAKVVEETQSTALMVKEDLRVENALQAYAPRTKKVKGSRGPSNTSAYHSGFRAGQSLPTTANKKLG